MKLVRKLSQHRRDFKGEYKCENCGHVYIDEGLDSYDDDNFHENVTPRWKCDKCGKSTLDLGLEPEKVQTKYRADQVI